MITGEKIWKTEYKGKEYWLLLIQRDTGDELHKFGTKLEATEYFLNAIKGRCN